LTNKRIGKLYSSSTRLLDAAASAVVNNDNAGIPALLPQKQAAKLLVHNELKPFKRHKVGHPIPGGEITRKELRLLAKAAAIELKLFYIIEVCADKDQARVNLKGFRAWLMDNLAQLDSPLNRWLTRHPEYSALASLIRHDGWWRKMLKTESKKRRKSSAV
jgi:hypothetical protein